MSSPLALRTRGRLSAGGGGGITYLIGGDDIELQAGALEIDLLPDSDIEIDGGNGAIDIETYEDLDIKNDRNEVDL